jgi:transcriptional regulator with XRE-family HTH domain
MTDLKKKFGQRVKKIRQNRNLSQEELAEKIDIAVNNMGKIERGESFVTAVTLEKLANVLGVKVEDFFKFDSFVSLDEMRSELDLNSLPECDIRQIYRFYKIFVENC